MIKAAIFDFGRVVSAPKPLSLFRSYERELGLKPDTINSIMFEHPAWEEALLGRRSEAEYWHTVGPILGLVGQSAIDAFRRRYRRDEAINPGIVELITRLRIDLKTALLSNAPPGLGEWLDDWALRDLFDVVFCSGDEGLAKPDPEAFRVVLQRLEVLPSEAVFVDDTFIHVQAAADLGMRGVHFSTVAALAEELQDILQR